MVNKPFLQKPALLTTTPFLYLVYLCLLANTQGEEICITDPRFTCCMPTSIRTQEEKTNSLLSLPDITNIFYCQATILSCNNINFYVTKQRISYTYTEALMSSSKAVTPANRNLLLWSFLFDLFLFDNPQHFGAIRQ